MLTPFASAWEAQKNRIIRAGLKVIWAISRVAKP
jgi:hypothetical protein